MSLFDFVVVLIGYTLSGEPTLLAFYERLLPVHGAVWSRISCPIARPFPAFAARSRSAHRGSTSQAMRKKIWLHASRLPLQAEWWIEQNNNGGLWMWMEPGLLLANVRYRRRSCCPLLIVVRDQVCAPGIRGASEEKWCVLERWYSRRIRTSFSARLEQQAMGITVANCDEPSR
jgi:hypothetical protein